jgi:hypothetical protein
MTKLTDTQLIVLSAASRREDGNLHPLPSNLKGGAANKVVDALIRKGLAELITDERIAVDDLVRITPAGLDAINVDPGEGSHAAGKGHERKAGATTPRKAKKAATGGDGATRAAAAAGRPVKSRAGTKQAAMIEMLRRPEGATIDQIVEATGWQRHTIRGAISGALKKKLGLNVTSEKAEGGERAYCITDAA